MEGSFDHSFALDEFQQLAGAAIAEGRNVLVAAPTGSGKTVAGEQAIQQALESDGRAFYTTPIKALSNQKFRDLTLTLGAENVGLLTGDHVVNPTASVVVMTTEVLRNMIYAGSAALDNLRWVVLDEVHFLQDAYRGAVWEEVLIHTPAGVRFACLSATVSNADELGSWIESLRGPTTTVVEHRRPVALDVLYLAGDRTAEEDHLVAMLIDGAPNPKGVRFDNEGDRSGAASGSSRGATRSGRPRSRFRSPRRTATVERLDAEGLLPAIYFVFSRKGCDEAAARCFADGVRLTNTDEAARIRSIIEETTSGLDDGDLDVLDYDRFAEAATRGIAPHHAGMVPAFREAVERCFAEGLLRIVFATETLALGINMPARSVVIEQLSKYTGDGHAMLTPGQFTQLTGRAGRRGIDDRGAAVVLWSPWVTFTTAAELAASREFPLESSFRPTYNMVANLVSRYREDQARSVLGRSFAQFQRDASLVGQRTHIERMAGELAEATAELVELEVDPGDAESYRGLVVTEQRLASATVRDTEAVERSLARLAPGDVVASTGGSAQRLVVVISTSERKHGVRVDALSARGKVVRLHSGDLNEPIGAVGRIELPVPYQPHDPEFRKHAAARLRRVNRKRLRSAGSARTSGDDRRSRELRAAQTALEAHHLHGHPERARIRDLAAHMVETRRTEARAHRRIDSNDSDLLERFDAVRSAMEHFGHLDGWLLTAAGRRLRTIFHESDLLISIAIGTGILDGLEPHDLAAMVSCFTHEHRGSDRPPPPRLPTRELQGRFGELRSLWRQVSTQEANLALPETREPSAGFSVPARLWCSGASLGNCLDDDLSGGDFVRNARNLVDLLSQVAQVAARDTASAAATAADVIGRDVVLGGGAPR